MKEPLIKSVMTPFPYAVLIGAPLGEARALMVEHGVRHLPVMSAAGLEGIVTDRDLKLLLGPELGSPDPRSLAVEDAYIDHCYSVDMHTPVAVVARHMAEKHIGAAVVTNHGDLVGIFTAQDACQALADYLQARFPKPPDGPAEAA